MKTIPRLEVRDGPLAQRVDVARWRELWIDGDPRALEPPLVTVIGTRDPDPRGVALATRIAADLAEQGVGVVSGGALGIDAAAHRGALLGDGRTVVVMPAGLEHWYPRRHGPLYREILRAGGALVSPFHPRTPPAGFTFPRRNELLAALADVVVVVQAPAASGALVCAEAAMRLGRRVLAVPGSTADRRAQGCNRLLRGGAGVCVDAADIFEALRTPEGELFARAPARASGAQGDAPARRPKAPELSASRARAKAPAEPPPTALDGPERVVYESLAFAPRHLDEVTRATGLQPAEVQRCALTLSLAGLIQDRGGGMFSRA
jgi:DNA processing protein